MTERATSRNTKRSETAYDRPDSALGEMGIYQRRLLFWLMIGSIGHGSWMLSTLFTMGTPQYRCAVPHLQNDTFEIQNEAHGLLVNTHIPFNDAKGSYSKCSQNKSDSNALGPNQTQQEACTEWVYSRRVFKTSLVSKLNLVCDREIYISHVNMMSMAGLMIGSLTSGPLSDRFGRKRLLIVFYPLHVIIAIATAFVTSVPALLFSRLVGTTFSVGLYSSIWLLGIETMSKDKRVYANTAAMYGWSLGLLVALCLAFFIREWQTLHLALEIPKILLALSCPWLFSESPVWLMSKGRYSEAEAILKAIARTNKSPAPQELLSGTSNCKMESTEQEISDGSVSKPMISPPDRALDKEDEYQTAAKTTHGKALLQLLKSSTMMLRIWILALNWLVCNMVYYGFQLNVGYIIEGNLYLNVLVVVLLEFVCITAVLYGLIKGGRKIVFCGCLFLSGVACIATIAPQYLDAEFKWLNVTLANIGKLGIAGAFATIWVYTSELLPTTLRQSGVGFCGFLSRLGGMISPYVARLDTIVGGPLGRALPLVLFGVAALTAGILSLALLPETAGKNLPESVEEAENLNNDVPKQESNVFHVESVQGRDRQQL